MTVAGDPPPEGVPTPGWHLSDKGRVWYAVEVKGERRYPRPAAQGGDWILADQIKVLDPVEV